MAYFKKTVYKLIYGKRLKFGKGTTFRKSFNIAMFDRGSISIGDRCFFNNGCSLNCLGRIEIGEGTILGEGVKIYDHNHKFADSENSLKDQGYSIGKVKIGKHCWIGSNAILLKGASVGDNCVIGAGCTISSPIPQNTVVKNLQHQILESVRSIS